jgi:hypothetical protein
MDKQQIIDSIRQGLDDGLISSDEVKQLLDSSKQAAQKINEDTTGDPDKLSAVDTMFYVAGILIFTAIMSFVVQSWDEGSSLVRILLTAGVGLTLWQISYFIIRDRLQTDVKVGLSNALLLTGSLCLIVGGYIMSNEITSGYEDINYSAGAVSLLVVGVMHLVFDSKINRKLILLLGLVLCVAAFPTFLFGLLKESGSGPDVWALVILGSSLLLAWSTRVAARVYPSRAKISNELDSVVAFICLATAYLSGFGSYATVWLTVLIGGVFGIFYLSILSKNKKMLGSASFFLVVAVVTLSFRYFAGYGVATSLIMSAAGLLGSAIVATKLKKKYFA